MKDSLKVGLSGERTYTVTDDMSPAHLPAKVLSTPAMIGLIEGTCLQTAQEHLESGEITVGVHVSFSHTGPAMSGEEVTVKARLSEMDRRRQTWEVEVLSPRGQISEGTHKRVVVDASRFG